MKKDKKEIIFVTSNKGKLASAKRVFAKTDITLNGYYYDLIEPRSEDVIEISKSKVLQAYNAVKAPCFALDVGFFIESLNGFPKTFVNFSLDTIGIEGILTLMQNKENRDCYFLEALAYYDGKQLKTFTCKIPGSIAKEMYKNDSDDMWSKLWYIYIPQGYTKTLAQMSDEERKQRKEKMPPEAIELFANWLNNNI